MLRKSTNGARTPTLLSAATLHGTYRNRRAALASLAARNEDNKSRTGSNITKLVLNNERGEIQQSQDTSQHQSHNQSRAQAAPSGILFDTRIAVPHVHELHNNRQLICPDCSTTQTEHYCNGSTAHVSTLCSKHEHLDSLAHPTEEGSEPSRKCWYDRDKLSNIRELLVHGDLRAPAEQLIHISDSNVDTGTLSKGELRRIKEQQALERFLPGCTPNKQDMGVHRGAPMGFARVVGEDYAFQRVWPVQPEAKYLHAFGCASSERPECILASRDEILAFRQFSAVMYRNEYEREDWCCAGYKRGRKCLPCARSARRWFEMACAPRWAIGVFLKRCNGMYINALGYMKDRKPAPWEGHEKEDVEENEKSSRDMVDFVGGLEFPARTLLAKEESVRSGRMTEKQSIEDSWQRWHVIDRERERRQREGDWKSMPHVENV